MALILFLDSQQFALILDALRWPVTASYLTLLGIICVYGLHRYALVAAFLRHRRDGFRGQERFDEDALPRVTIQLPMFNESSVAQRVIDSACAVDYPPDRLQVQVLDDSTDDTRQIARDRCDHWRARGIDIEYRHRTNRTGYKAGALAEATGPATGELIAVFDADFVIPADFLRRSIHPFTDPGVGMVQTRWDHLNRDDSWLTRAQAVFLDGHFVIEHTARHRSGCWMNFNGTAGIWRKQAIADAGGWEHDTLTEDLDLSYRAQLAGWRFVFLPRVACPAELPPEVPAFKSQQHRWTKGSIQCAIKLLPRVFAANIPWRVKREAFFHLTAPLVYLYITLLAMLLLPVFAVNNEPMINNLLLSTLVGLSLFAMGSISASVFYVTSQAVLGRGVWPTIVIIPWLMAVGIGIAVNNARACLEALAGLESPFVRTPKFNRVTGQAAPASQPATRRALRDRLPRLSLDKATVCGVELLLAGYMIACAGLSLSTSWTMISLPFLLLFAAGYGYIGWQTLRATAGAAARS